MSLKGLVAIDAPPAFGTTDQRTHLTTASAVVSIQNKSKEEIYGPVYLVFTLSPAATQMPGAQGGPKVGPFKKYYVDVTSLLADQKLSPHEKVSAPVVFVYPATAWLSYSVEGFGTRVSNDPSCNK